MRSHSHYFRNVSHLKEIDIYRVLSLFNVTDPALAHAIKKLVVPGMRGGGKTTRKDIEEARDTLARKLEMLDEDEVEVALAGVSDKSAEASSDFFDEGYGPWVRKAAMTFTLPDSTYVQLRDANGLVLRQGSVGDLSWVGATDYRVRKDA
jgi:hypothetical protein